MATRALANIPKQYADKLYLWSGLSELQTQVTKIGQDQDGKFLGLAQTLFHPQGGGQKSDVGTINDAKVLKVTKEGTPTEFQVKHYVEDTSPFSPGMDVVIKVDMTVRSLHASLHSAGHLLGSLMEERQGCTISRAHHFPGDAYVSCKVTENVTDLDGLKTNLLEQMSREIALKRGIAVSFEGDTRFIAFDGYEKVPCGGTHLENTGEIKNFSIDGVTCKKGNLTVRYSSEG